MGLWFGCPFGKLFSSFQRPLEMSFYCPFLFSSIWAGFGSQPLEFCQSFSWPLAFPSPENGAALIYLFQCIHPHLCIFFLGYYDGMGLHWRCLSWCNCLRLQEQLIPGASGAIPGVHHAMNKKRYGLWIENILIKTNICSRFSNYIELWISD